MTASTATVTARSRIIELDGVRGIAILLVLAYHTSIRMPQEPATAAAYFVRLNTLSWSGVDLFFVLSGFLICGSLIDSRNTPTYFSSFYLRRACRILPLYWVMLAALYILNRFGVTETHQSLLPITYYLTFTQNISTFIHGWGNSFSQTWSLAIEEQFYLTAPLIIWFTPQRLLRRVLLILVCIAIMARSVYALNAFEPATSVYVMMPFRMDALLLGALAAMALREPETRQWLQRNNATIYAILSLLSLAAGTMLIRKLGLGSMIVITGGFSVLASMYAVFLLLALQEGPIRRICRAAILRKFGVLAYGLYLLHLAIPDFLLQAFGAHQLLTNWYDWAVFILSMGVVFALASLSWRYFESPIIEWARRSEADFTSFGRALLARRKRPLRRAD
jgi:peptidoglycan/LPS O-acetylase OafA/YrhL